MRYLNGLKEILPIVSSEEDTESFERSFVMFCLVAWLDGFKFVGFLYIGTWGNLAGFGGITSTSLIILM